MKLRALASMLFAASLFFTVVASASAYTTIGGKYASSTITWTFQGTGALYNLAAANGINAWNNANTDVEFKSAIISEDVNVILRHADYGNTGWNGRCANKPVHTSGTYTRSDIDFNENYMDDMTTAQRQGTAAHELGHAIGLDHVTATNQVMCTAADGRAVNVPGSDDKAGANALY